MPLPKKNFIGQRCSVSMMELRAQPGAAVDAASHGLVIQIEKNGKIAAVLGPPEGHGERTTIKSDGSISGAAPVTFRRNLGDGY